MRKLYFLPLFIILFPFVGHTQNHWLVIEEASYNNINFKLEVIHQPSLADSIWMRLVIDNQNPSPREILQSSIQIKLQAFEQENQVIQKGMCSSTNPSEFFDDLEEHLFELEKLQPGKNIISRYPCAYGASILGIPTKHFYKVSASIHFTLQLGGEAPLQIDWDGIQFDMDWYRPNELQIKVLQGRLNSLIQQPSYNSSHFYRLSSCLKEEAIYSVLDNQTVIEALKIYENFPEGKLALLYFINDNFNKDKKILDYYEALIKSHNNVALTDLKSMPLLWKNSYLTLFWDWFQQANLGTQIRIIDILFLNQNKWIKNKNFCKQLSDHLLNTYSEILYALPEDLSTDDLKLWGSLASALGKTGDVASIGIICPFLQSKTELLTRDIIIFADSYEVPRPIRACDIALEAILHLQQKDVRLTYEKTGFFPPYWNGEAEIIITRVRDTLIRELGYSDVCRY